MSELRCDSLGAAALWCLRTVNGETWTCPSAAEFVHGCWRRKVGLWDPLSSALAFTLAVFVYTDVASFMEGSKYQGGFADVKRDWTTTPIVNMAWVAQHTACPKGWEEPPFVDAVFHPVEGARPSGDQQRLCLQRAGLVADSGEGPPRPRTHCESSEKLKTCMSGSFPYCGQAGVPCPLVDVKDFVTHGTPPNMRHRCESKIPAADLPWTGCRPIVRVVTASEPPCFEYDVMGWNSGSTHEYGMDIPRSQKKCIRRDTRYRFMKSLPFVSGDHNRQVKITPDTGVYFRNELFFNPKCGESQDEFEEGYQEVEALLQRSIPVLVLTGISMVFTGFFVAVFAKGGPRAQKIHLDFSSDPCEISVLLTMLCRAVSIVYVVNNVLSLIYYTEGYFLSITQDETCVDPLLAHFVRQFLLDLSWIRMKFMLCLLVLVSQVTIDVFHASRIYAAWSHEKDEMATSHLAEAAPLFQPLPPESEEHIANRKGIKYVYLPQDASLPKDVR